MFEETRRSLTRYYTAVTAAALALFAVVLFASSAWFLYDEEKAEIMAFAQEEKSEHLPLLQKNGAFAEQYNHPEESASNEEIQNALRMFSIIKMPSGEFFHLTALPNEIHKWAIHEIEKSNGIPEPKIFSCKFNGIHHRILLVEKTIVDNGKHLGTIYVGKDITSIIDMFKKMLLFSFLAGMFFIYMLSRFGRIAANKAMIPIEEALERQKRFITDASHELRTPLSVTLTGTEVLLADRENHLSSESKDTLAIIKDEVRKMANLVQNLLVLSRLDETAVTEADDTDITELSAQAVRNFLPLAAQKNISLALKHTRPLYWRVNKNDLFQMLYILLDNAIKYTPDNGNVSVFVHQQTTELKILVEDTGIGIEDSEQKLIFDRFYRVDKARSRQTGGNGLGLSIARAIAEKQHGTIEVSSVKDAGSTFVIILPKQK